MKQLPGYMFDTIFFDQIITFLPDNYSKLTNIYYDDNAPNRIFGPLIIFLYSHYED